MEMLFRRSKGVGKSSLPLPLRVIPTRWFLGISSVSVRTIVRQVAVEIVGLRRSIESGDLIRRVERITGHYSGKLGLPKLPIS